MTDRLKLSDLKDGAKADEVAKLLIVEDAQKRIKELERNIATLEKTLASRQARSSPPSGTAPLGARKDAKFKAISTAPSINKTPRGSVMVPVAYSTFQDLSNSVGVAKTVRFNGNPVYLLDGSTQPTCQGDEAGTGGGVRSGTVNGEVKPTTGSRNVRVEGKSVVRVNDKCTMNAGNNPGAYVANPTPPTGSPNHAIVTSNPSLTMVTEDETARLTHVVNQTREQLIAAVNNP